MSSRFKFSGRVGKKAIKARIPRAQMMAVDVHDMKPFEEMPRMKSMGDSFHTTRYKDFARSVTTTRGGGH